MRTVLLRNRINEEIDLSTEDYFATGLSNMGFEVKRTCGTVGNFRESSESVEISEFQSSVIISVHGFREKNCTIHLCSSYRKVRLNWNLLLTAKQW